MGKRMAGLAVVALVLAVAPAQAQLLPGLSFKAGATVPLRNEADFFGGGVHLGAALKLPIVPLQIEGAMDRMGGKDSGGVDADDLTLWSVGAAIPITIAPPLSPVAPYLIAGGGLYKYDAGESQSDVGLNGGAGVRLSLASFKPFIEGRGVLVLADRNKLTYFTAAVGLRF